MTSSASSSAAVAEAKLADMTAKMAAREADIRRRLEDLREARADGRTEAEQYTAFEAAFEAERLDIVADLESLKVATTTSVELNNRMAAINERIGCLQRYHSDSVGFLPAYVSASAKTKVEELVASLAAVRDRLVPKKKFAFSSGRSAVPSAPAAAAPSAAAPKPKQQQKQLEPTLHGLSGANVVLEDATVAAKDVLLSDLTDCTVRLLSHPATLHLHNLTNCTVLCGPVHRSSLIERCTNCTLVLACHQLRLHTSTNCRLYLHVTSTPIVEDCTGIATAPYSLSYGNLTDHVTASGLNWDKNFWDRIQDFYHLAGHVASPNWSVMPESDRQTWEE